MDEITNVKKRLMFSANNSIPLSSTFAREVLDVVGELEKEIDRLNDRSGAMFNKINAAIEAYKKLNGGLMPAEIVLNFPAWEMLRKEVESWSIPPEMNYHNTPESGLRCYGARVRAIEDGNTSPVIYTTSYWTAYPVKL